jgi:hypothetical protein
MQQVALAYCNMLQLHFSRFGSFDFGRDAFLAFSGLTMSARRMISSNESSLVICFIFSHLSSKCTNPHCHCRLPMDFIWIRFFEVFVICAIQGKCSLECRAVSETDGPAFSLSFKV